MPSARLPARRSTIVGLMVTLAVLAAAIGLVAVPSLIVRQRLARAKQAFDARNYEAAIAWLRRAQKVAPKHPQAQLLLAQTYRQLGDLDTAAQHLNEAMNSGLPEQFVDLENKLALAQSGRMQEVQPYLGPLMQVAGEDRRTLYEAFARGYLLQRRFKEAGGMLDNWVSQTRDDPWPSVYRGHIWSAQFRWDKAAQEYRTALRLDPKIAAAQWGLARALVESGSAAEAEPHFRACVELDAENVAARTGLATCLIAAKKLDEARQMLDEARQRSKNDDEVQLGDAAIAFAEERYEDALQQLEPILAKWPQDQDTNELRADVLEALGRADEAAQARATAAEAAEQLAQIPSLLKLVNDQISGEARYELGLVLLKHASREDGRQWIEAALLIDGSMKQARQLLVDYYEYRGQPRQANFHQQMMDVLPH